MSVQSVAPYNKVEMVQAFRDVGIRPGNVVFFHVSAESGGETGWDGLTPQEVLLEAMQEAVGMQGTILIPTYTFSFCRYETFDVQQTPTAGGPWSNSSTFLEYFRRQPGVVRSSDPIHSVAGLGPCAEQLLTNLPHTCFGKGSVHERLMKVNGKICTIGVGLNEATFRHHVEEIVGVPFRFKKMFTGYVRENGVLSKQAWLYNVRILADNAFPDGSYLEDLAVAAGRCAVAPSGAGRLWSVEARDYFELVRSELMRNSWCTAKGPAGDPIELETRRVSALPMVVSLPPAASIEDMLTALWALPRDIVSSGYDAALLALAGQVPMHIHEYPSGTECWSWIVPERWTCHEGYLETLDGRRLFSYEDNPLHVVSYSLPFEGEVSRETLFQHLHTHKKLSDAIPFIFKYYERDWGLCCSRDLKETLTDDRYRVVIKTDFSFGSLKVGEVVAEGKSDESIILCAHLCHPHQVNDDLSGVLVGIEVMRRLLQRKDLRYTYRYLILPETIGSIAYMSKNEALLPKVKGGLFLEMLGLKNPHALQYSFKSDSEVDQCFDLALKANDSDAWTVPFRTLVGNDERQFNAPGVRVPFLALLRVLPPGHPQYPYAQYHSSHDNPALVSIEALEESVETVLKMIDTLEQNRIPVNNFKGEVFCSRYGLFVDWFSHPDGNKVLFSVMDHIDGSRSIAEIAKLCGTSFDAVKAIVDELYQNGLVTYQTGSVK